MLAFIPSPHTGVVHVGPLTLHMYGLTLLVAILACIWLTGKRWVAQGGEWELVTRVAVWGVAFGVLGARLYHDITSWNEVPSPKWQGIFEVWKGGLGVWGGIALGAFVGSIVVRRAGANVGVFLDAAAPGLLLAQGIGRIGNWWNQELFGKPTDLPWALKIDAAHRPVQYFDRLFALYVVWYTFGRFFEELLRIDPAHHIAGLRLNAWVSIILFVLSVAYFVWHQFLSGREKKPPAPEHRPAMAIPKSRVR
jgi:prolipoprotein diacylglyceryltransferase